jgi:hypothetical protein
MFIRAMKIDVNSALSTNNSDDDDEDQGLSTFGSWRNIDEDDSEIGEGIEGEWNEYLKTGRVRDTNGFSLRTWWLANEGKFPILSRVALDLLAVPAMSTEVERIFSGYGISIALINNSTKLTLTSLRSRLSPDAVEAIEVCAALYKKGLFADNVPDKDE